MCLSLLLVTNTENAYQKIIFPLWKKALLGISLQSLHDFPLNLLIL